MLPRARATRIKTKGFEKKMRKFVENGGTLVTTYWSGIVDDTDLCKMGGLPGDMMDVFGVWNEEIDSLPDGMKNGIAFNGSRYDAMELCARIHPLTAARTGSDMLSVLYGEMIETLHIEKALDCALPHGVTAHIRHGEKENIIFVENYTESGKTVELPRDYKLYGTDQTVNSIKLAPFGIALLSDLTKV